MLQSKWHCRISTVLSVSLALNKASSKLFVIPSWDLGLTFINEFSKALHVFLRNNFH